MNIKPNTCYMLTGNVGGSNQSSGRFWLNDITDYDESHTLKWLFY